MKRFRLFSRHPLRFKFILLGIFFALFCCMYLQNDKSVLQVYVNDTASLDVALQIEENNLALGLDNGTPTATVPLNEYPYPFIIPNLKKCMSIVGTAIDVDLLLVVKSAVSNLERRRTIRDTWGVEERFPDVVIRRIFNVGWDVGNAKIQQQVLDEQIQNGDIVQSAFVDNYYNNTIKTMMGMRWVTENCPTAKFVLFVDDDMYISVKNVLRFVSHPVGYPKYYVQKSIDNALKNTTEEVELQIRPIENLYAGHTMVNFSPHRSPKSKWHISHEDYPFKKYPTFVLAGAFVMSFPTLKKMYETSRYTKHLRFDDVYLGLVAKNAGIVPLHNDHFNNWSLPSSYRFIISAHLYGDTKKLIQIWKKQQSLQNV